MELRQREGEDAFHPSIQYFLGNLDCFCVVIVKINSLNNPANT